MTQGKAPEDRPASIMMAGVAKPGSPSGETASQGAGSKFEETAEGEDEDEDEDEDKEADGEIVLLDDMPRHFPFGPSHAVRSRDAALLFPLCHDEKREAGYCYAELADSSELLLQFGRVVHHNPFDFVHVTVSHAGSDPRVLPAGGLPSPCRCLYRLTHAARALSRTVLKPPLPETTHEYHCSSACS